MAAFSRSRRFAGTALVALGAMTLGLVLGFSLKMAGGAPSGHRNSPVPRDIASYPKVTGGEWVRGPNLTDGDGEPQPRQEHAAVELNGFVYLIGGFVPMEPAPEPSENEPEPFPFHGTGEVLVYTPHGHPTAPDDEEGRWSTLPPSSSFPVADKHHIVAVAHQGEIWAFGGHAGPFEPTRDVFVFSPDDPGSPEGTWTRVTAEDGSPCADDDACLQLPKPRAAGAAVSVGDSIYLIGGVVPYRDSPDPVNQSIRTTRSVIVLDTSASPLRWRRAASLRHPREHFNAVVVDGRIWVFHGRGEASTHMRSVESWAPGNANWRAEQGAPVGTSANILAAVDDCVYSFGGEFIASNVTGTLIASQVFHVPSRSWRVLESTVRTEPLDATGATSKHGTYGVHFVEDGEDKVMAPGGAATAWFDPMSKVHVFTPPPECS